jgi:hypothetical protein
MKNDLATAVGALVEITGAPLPLDLVRVVYSPRPGWGYVRRPLIVVSEEAARAARADRFGRARDLRYVAHEVAHCWWQMADASTPDDWINEGLAEYSAFLASGRIFGAEFAEALLADYRLRSATSATVSAIAETASSSPDREVNRYARPVLLLTDLQRRYGEERTGEFVRALYRRFAADGRATTDAFLDEASRRLGKDARESLATTLFRRDWSDATPRYAYSPKDAAFLGTWTGALTQAGATTRVILHLVLRDGALVATLDSPDQGAKDIPVPVVRVSGPTLFFALGAFGISYEGELSDDAAQIRGRWTQAGTGVPLELERSQPTS